MSSVKYRIKKNTYFDSVTLMIISKEIKKIEGVKEALIGMATDLNKEIAGRLELSNAEIEELTPNDFFITVLVEDEVKIEDIMIEVDNLLNQKKKARSDDYMPPTLDSAIKHEPESNMVVISVPGKYAADEARKALKNGLNVMLFSDNVTIEEEKELKDLAVSKELLMMGPDCGTAIINNVPLAFANVVRKGHIGVVGASGTGTQEVTVLIDKLGEGVSQVIGTGGRDLKKEIGGSMMLLGIDALMNDPETKVILLVSKPPAEEIAEKILKRVKDSPKPVVVDFIGGDKNLIEEYGAYPCISLEDATRKAVALLRNEEVKDFDGFDLSSEEIDKIVNEEVKKFAPEQKYFRGFYTGGTLADECMKLLSKDVKDIYSNIPLSPEYRLKDINVSTENTCIDFGDDEFTVGKPHPMIDPMNRVERLIKESDDDEMAVVLMDFVLGYGSHMDPVGEMIPAIIDVKEKMAARGKHLCVVGYVCGTDNDPQNLKESKKRLEEIGVIVMPSNAQAVKLTGLILSKIK
ncbi:acyl-CoA synthetase FdrA [Tissierella sp. Yu-01]|uniref:acyl-CoA synthetase FdrA n=1 Tax=Tissierella sp. Yu-01 TaxID=3035694 RepID=UPI00240D631F|nr:acyl-CoA synthetase FdrA [Tissierella sp. Yu-01]WFA10110.1 acyl-CoA synthetase FdrA [Tissierella sp. Yu-01]